MTMKLAVPDMISNSYFPAIAAIELGFFEQEGLDVSLELIFPVDKAYAALREGSIDFVGGSAHSALSAFPEWRGVKLLCAQAQGMYWFLVMHADLEARRGDIASVKGRSIGAAPWVEMSLRRLLVEAGIDLTRDAVKKALTLATQVGRKLFPPTEAELIAELIRRDLPFYDASISRTFVAGMNQFARELGILKDDVPYEEVVVGQFGSLWAG